MLKMLSDFITKRPWAVVALWLLILIVSIPLATGLDGRLHYDITSFIPQEMESSKANDLYEQQFPDESKSQIVVAIQSDNKTAAMLFIRDLNDSVSADDRIGNFSSSTSIYDIQRTVLTGMAPEVHSGLHDAYENASDVSDELYDARADVVDANRQLYEAWDNFTEASSQLDDAYVRITGIGSEPGLSSQLYSARDQIVSANAGLYQIKDAADLVYGIPGCYAQVWGGARAGGMSDAAACARAYQDTLSVAVNPISDPASKALASAYLGQYNQTWMALVTASPALAANPSALAQQTIDTMGKPFFDAAVSDTQKHQVFVDLLGLKLSGYADAGALKSYVVGHAMAYQGLSSDEDRAKLSAIYDLGKNPGSGAVDQLTLQLATSGLPDSDATQAREIYALGRSPSDDTIKNYIIGKASEGKNDTEKQAIQDAWSLRRSTGDVYDKYVLDRAGEDKNESERQTINEVFALGRQPNASVVDSYVLSQAYEGRNETEQQLIREIYALGESPGEAALQDYTCYKVADHLNVAGNLSFFGALLSMDRNASEEDVKEFATDWAYSHDYTNPEVFPHEIEGQLVSGNMTLYAVSLNSETAAKSTHNAVTYIREDIANISDTYPGVSAYVTGMPAIGLDTETAAVADVNNIDKISVVLILLILGVYFVSVLTPFIPLAAIGAAIVTGFGMLYLSSYTVDLYYLTKTFMIVVMLGAGTDYCVFILSRYAEERNIGKDVAESVRYAIEHAGKSILCSGLTAMIGFASLMLIDHGMFRSMGQSMALAILISMLVAMTLIPAVLVLAGDRLFWPRKIFNTGRKKSATGGVMKKIVSGVVSHPALVVLLTVLLALPAVWLYAQMQPGQDIVSMLPDRLESKTGFNMLQDTFGSGNIDRAKIVVTLPENLTEADGSYSASALDRVERISAIARATEGVDTVYSMSRPQGDLINYANMSEYTEVQRAFYEQTMNDSIGTDGRTTVISVAFNGSPYSAESDMAIDSLREKLALYAEGEGNGTTILVGGSGAQSYDFQNMASGKFGIVIAVVFIGIFLVFAVLLRSVVAPLKLFVSMLLGIVWTLAIFTLAFQLWAGMSVIWILPIVLFCTLMGLGGDYVVFMMSRVHEEIQKGASDKEAILTAVEVTGPVILLCGVVMAAAFGSMMISDMAELREFGFVLSLAIMLDATVMVLVLIPSIMMVANRLNWWTPLKRRQKPPMEAAAVPEEKSKEP